MRSGACVTSSALESEGSTAEAVVLDEVVAVAAAEALVLERAWLEAVAALAPAEDVAEAAEGRGSKLRRRASGSVARSAAFEPASVLLSC